MLRVGMVGRPQGPNERVLGKARQVLRVGMVGRAHQGSDDGVVWKTSSRVV